MRNTVVLFAGIRINAYLTFKDDTFSPPPNLNTCISLVENYSFAQCLGWTFSPIPTFFSLVSFRAFRDAPHSRFRCRVPNQWLYFFLKMLVLALFKMSNIYFTCGVYRFGQCLVKRFSPLKSFFSLVRSRTIRVAAHSLFSCRDADQCLPNVSKMLFLNLLQIYTRVFHLWKTIDLLSAWGRDCRPYQLSFLLQVLAACLEMRHTGVSSGGFPNNGYLSF